MKFNSSNLHFFIVNSVKFVKSINFRGNKFALNFTSINSHDLSLLFLNISIIYSIFSSSFIFSSYFVLLSPKNNSSVIVKSDTS